MSIFTRWKFLLYLLGGLIFFGLGWLVHCRYGNNAGRHEVRFVKLKQSYKYINPLLDVELPEGVNLRSIPIPFKYKVESLVKQTKKAGHVTEVAVYFRDLGDGPWFGINQDLEFDAASLMKVTVMIAWLKRAEGDPRQLSRTFTYDGKEDLSVRQVFRPSQTLVANQRYTVEELLHYMMAFSDNNSTRLLFNALSEQELNAVIENMDVNYSPNDSSNHISSHGYSGFFRVLYNASYLNRKMSEKALQLLSEQEFKVGVVAGVPAGVVVASKFGEMEMGRGGVVKQLHDFGIVYHPRGHYILGIMTSGSSFERQVEVIRDISALVYKEFEVTVNAKGKPAGLK